MARAPMVTLSKHVLVSLGTLWRLGGPDHRRSLAKLLRERFALVLARFSYLVIICSHHSRTLIGSVDFQRTTIAERIKTLEGAALRQANLVRLPFDDICNTLRLSRCTLASLELAIVPYRVSSSAEIKSTISHFLVLWLVTGNPHFDLTYPGH